MRALNLLIRLSLYYLTIAILVSALLYFFPGAVDYVPVGGAETILSGASGDPFAPIEVGATQISDLLGSLVWVSIAILSSLLIAIPVCWTYIACRKRNEYDNSIVRTILILPMLLTSIVLIVHDSLALAFSLAGIVGAVRFRNTLKSPGDALYVLQAIGIGLSAGIGAVEVAVVTTVLINYSYVVLWYTEFGVMNGSIRYMRRPYGAVSEIDSDEVDGASK